jgi:hypothetical protein
MFHSGVDSLRFMPGAAGLTSLKMAFIENLTDEDIEHLAALRSLEVLTLNVSPHAAIRAEPFQQLHVVDQVEQLEI